jgi:CheY-like chemotaxis protein
VDDEAHNRSMLVDILEPIGFDVTVVGSGQESIEIVPKIYPDVILMDLIMPDMSGIQAVEKIRGLESLQDKYLAIIATSASVNDELQMESKNVGCDDFMAKPIVAESLLKTIEKQLDLEWIYEESAHDDNIQKQEIFKSDTEGLIPPPLEEITILFDLAKKGDLSRLRKRVVQVEQMDDRFIPFAKKLYQLVDKVDEDRILILLERYTHEKEN